MVCSDSLRGARAAAHLPPPFPPPRAPARPLRPPPADRGPRGVRGPAPPLHRRPCGLLGVGGGRLSLAAKGEPAGAQARQRKQGREGESALFPCARANSSSLGLCGARHTLVAARSARGAAPAGRPTCPRPHTRTPAHPALQWVPDHYSYNFDQSKGPIGISWFKGARTNISYNCLDRRARAPARCICSALRARGRCLRPLPTWHREGVVQRPLPGPPLYVPSLPFTLCAPPPPCCAPPRARDRAAPPCKPPPHPHCHTPPPRASRWVAAGAGSRTCFISEGNDLGHEKSMTYSQALTQTCRVVRGNACACGMRMRMRTRGRAACPARACLARNPPQAGRRLRAGRASTAHALPDARSTPPTPRRRPTGCAGRACARATRCSSTCPWCGAPAGCALTRAVANTRMHTQQCLVRSRAAQKSPTLKCWQDTDQATRRDSTGL